MAFMELYVTDKGTLHGAQCAECGASITAPTLRAMSEKLEAINANITGETK